MTISPLFEEVIHVKFETLGGKAGLRNWLKCGADAEQKARCGEYVFGMRPFSDMKMAIHMVRILVLVLLQGGLIGCHQSSLTADEQGERIEDIGLPTWPDRVPEGKIDFGRHVRPLLIINCLECHNSQDAKDNGNFNLETKELAMTTGTAPPALLPGNPDESLLIKVLTLDKAHQKSMPPAPDKIWGIRMAILRRWIKEGAEWPGEIRLVHPSEIKSW